MKLIVVTPAGRERYLRLLSHYVLASPAVAEWQLWDNCRNAADRSYLRRLAESDSRCVIKELATANGHPESIGDFFRFCDDPEAIYLRLDDDIVFVEDGFFERFVRRMLDARGNALWFAPLIVNNAICNALLQNLAPLKIEGPISMQATCPFSWAHASFPEAIHPVLVEAVRRNRLDAFRIPDREHRLGRFSINALGFFGDEIVALGKDFLPPNKEEEEWFSAVLPTRLNRGGLILGDLLVAHFAFYPQERWLLRTGILDQYYGLAGLIPPDYQRGSRSPLRRVQEWSKRKQAPEYRISLPNAAASTV